MSQITKSVPVRAVISLLIFPTFWWFLASGVSFAQPDELYSPNVLGKNVLATIWEVTEDDIQTNAGQFVITEATRIYDNEGSEITLGDLPVPSRAEIEYEPLLGSGLSAVSIVINESLQESKLKRPFILPE